MDFVDHPVFNASETCDKSHSAIFNKCHKTYDKKKQDEMCEKLLKCMGDDKTLQNKYERECDSFIYRLKPDIIWMV